MRQLMEFQVSPADGMNRAFDDKSMKFGTHLEETLRKISGYRAIAHFTRNKNGSYFPVMAESH
jgi:hypothetical protein